MSDQQKAKWGVYPCEQCAAKNQEITAKDAEIARQQHNRHVEGKMAQELRVEIARLTAERDCALNTLKHCQDHTDELLHLRDLVAVGQLIVDANEMWLGKTVHTEEWRRLEAKWRSLERER